MSKSIGVSSLFQRALFGAACWSAASCSNPFSGGDCLAIGVFAISATVVDANTGKAPTASPQLRIEDGTFVEEYLTPMPRTDPPSFSGAAERVGVYRVVVTAMGYRDFVAEGIVVRRAGNCQYLQGVRLNVKLVSSR
ncbi:MAG: hypothetical protein ABI120_00790 [Gemmatimonadaceae bacterium]